MRLLRHLGSGAALAAGLALASVSPAFAHHSTAMFDMTKEMSVSGTIKEFQWTQPHTWIVFEAPSASGAPEEYQFEGMSPSYLDRNGWSKHTLAPGDKVTISYHPLKDGRKGGFNSKVTWPDGHYLYNLPHRPDAAQVAEGKAQ